MKNIRVAITGGIGSGKSTFANYLASKGYVVINADDISKDILTFDESIIKKVIKEFGSDSYKDGKLNKKFIAAQVFSNPAKLNKLNSILHPRVLQKIDTLIEKKYKGELTCRCKAQRSNDHRPTPCWALDSSSAIL